METIAEMVCGGFVRVKDGAVLVGPCSCGECPPICPLSIDELWLSWKGLGNWVDVGEGSVGTSPQLIGSAEISALTAYPPPVSWWASSADLPVGRYRVTWSSGLWKPSGSAAFMVGDYVGAPFDVFRTPRIAVGNQDSAGDITNDVRGPMDGELSVEFDLLSPAAIGVYLDDGWSQARGVGWYADNSGGPLVFELTLTGVPSVSERHRGCLRFVWLCVSGGLVQSWQVLGGEVADAVDKVAPFLEGDGQYFFAVEFYGRRLGNTPGGRTFISRDDDWVVYRWLNPPV